VRPPHPLLYKALDKCYESQCKTRRQTQDETRANPALAGTE